MEVRPNVGRPLLVHQDGSYLTRFQFQATIKKCVLSLGWEGDGFKSHSFRIGAANLGLPVVTIMGIGLLPLLSRYVDRYGAPHILVLHAGGSDLSSVPMRLFIQDIKCDWWRLIRRFPGTLLVWSDIVDRFTWREARFNDAISKDRVKVNREVGKFAVRTGGLALRHMELEEKEISVYREDGVHLNEIGLDIFNMSLQDGLEKALVVWGEQRILRG
ncbi:hypothetical protein XELAEV_18029445mg [Xenopus laevis]|uniref:Uncharacterized protein n=1 Tax=Xenopus laevis TaxID=8355 RepID=A0A974CTG2_XENLA|nr:hypothetical protein XELAEV_18029445mg [Xenopus laevis]